MSLLNLHLQYFWQQIKVQIWNLSYILVTYIVLNCYFLIINVDLIFIVYIHFGWKSDYECPC